MQRHPTQQQISTTNVTLDNDDELLKAYSLYNEDEEAISTELSPYGLPNKKSPS